MTVSLYQIAIDCSNAPALARFWASVLDWRILYEDPEEIIIGAEAGALPGIVFLTVPEHKSVKNRLHLDLTPDDQEAEVARIIGLGAAGSMSGRART